MPDREGVVRVVKLRTSKRTLLRPIQKQKDELDVLKKTDATEKEKLIVESQNRSILKHNMDNRCT